LGKWGIALMGNWVIFSTSLFQTQKTNLKENNKGKIQNIYSFGVGIFLGFGGFGFGV
jgi:hypothetical protein